MTYCRRSEIKLELARLAVRLASNILVNKMYATKPPMVPVYLTDSRADIEARQQRAEASLRCDHCGRSVRYVDSRQGIGGGYIHAEPSNSSDPHMCVVTVEDVVLASQ